MFLAGSVFHTKIEKPPVCSERNHRVTNEQTESKLPARPQHH